MRLGVGRKPVRYGCESSLLGPIGSENQLLSPASVSSPSRVCILRWKSHILPTGFSRGKGPWAELMAPDAGVQLNCWREAEPSAKWYET